MPDKNQELAGAQGDREGNPGGQGTPGGQQDGSRLKKDQTIEEQRKKSMGDLKGSQSHHGGRFQEKDQHGQAGRIAKAGRSDRGEKRTGSESGGGKSGGKKSGNR